MIKFTKEEKIILLFLGATFLIGTAVLYYKSLNPKSHPFIRFEETSIEISEKININRATRKELVKIKGIGPALSGRIMSYREKHGHFKTAEDIKNVKGIGDKTFEKIKRQITLE